MLNRRAVVQELLRERGDLIVVTGLGTPAFDVASCGNEPLDFPLWGAMGGAAMLGLGLALAQTEHRVLVLTGDGEMLMGLGSLATIAAVSPENLRIVILDNERFGETGQQLTHTALCTDLAAVARGCGLASATTLSQPTEIEALRNDIHSQPQTLFAVVKVDPESPVRCFPPRDGAYLTHRLRTALLGEEHAAEEDVK